MNPVRILLVEDDTMIASGLSYALEAEGYIVAHAKDIATARQLAAEAPFDLAVLDMQLPDGSGSDILAAVKPAGTAALFLTVVDDEGVMVQALENGADDYIVKPFRLREFLARVKTVLRRRTGGTGDTLTVGDVIIHPLKNSVSVHGVPLELTALEYKMLLLFASHPGQTLTRTQILDHLWDGAGDFVEDNTLTVCIKRLRQKLGDAADIETVRGVGYRVAEKKDH
ncbi:MAG TPA: response regulator transcription factor [Candidatus Limiplasma sp.]|nr:response regulator transcription factor [Candidatus Limiplasma sp.]HRX08311.1 response regulator transcription factor [Candidatus Limiplasma sp.]